MDWQTIIVWLIGAAVVWILLRRVVRLLKDPARGACDGCPADRCPHSCPSAAKRD